MQKEPIDFKNVALQNERLVINLLRRHGVMSQTQLRKLSGLSTSTSSYIIARLRAKGYIVETKGVSTKRGAKPVNLEINPAGCFAIGVEIRTDSVYGGIFDFNFNPVQTVFLPLKNTTAPEVAKAVKKVAETLLETHKEARGKVLGVATAISGSIRDNSVVVLSSPLGWRNVEFKKILSELIDLPIMLYPTQVRMLAELDIEKPKKDMFYINIGNGVGGHIILDGHLCSGATGRIGEIGHIVMQPEGRLCGCGNKGCLETIISGRALAAKIKSDAEKGLCPKLAAVVKPEDLPETVVAKWGELIKEADPYSTELADYTANYLAIAASAMVNICDPQVITLAGYVSENCYRILEQKLKTVFQSRVYNCSERNLTINMAIGGKNALIKGAAISILQG